MELNKNKIQQIVDHIQDGGELSAVAICKAAGLNARYKSWEKYLAEAHKQHPDIVPAKLPKTVAAAEPAPVEEAADDMLGEDTEVDCPEGKTGDDCCGDPANCTKEKVEPVATPEPEVAAPVTLPPSKGLTYTLINDKGLAVPLSLVKTTSTRVVLEVQVDEVIEVSIQGVVVPVNITKLRAEGKGAEADFYLSQRK